MTLRLSLPLFFALVLLGVGAATASAQTCDAPPSKLKIVPPPDSVPKAAAAFSGVWRGDWPIAAKKQVVPLCARLSVMVASPQAVSVEQCTGSQPAAKLKPQCRYYVAQIDGDTMTFTDPDGSVFTFEMKDVGGMLAETVSAEHKSSTQFTKPE